MMDVPNLRRISLIEELTTSIEWRKADMRRYKISQSARKGHKHRIDRMVDKRKKLQRHYDDHCKDDFCRVR